MGKVLKEQTVIDVLDIAYFVITEVDDEPDRFAYEVEVTPYSTRKTSLRYYATLSGALRYVANQIENIAHAARRA